MSPTAIKVEQLRNLLAERFASSLPSPHAVCITGFAPLDQFNIPQAALTEIVAQPDFQKRGGVTLLLYSVLKAWLKRERAVLIDSCDCFSPHALEQPELDRLLWLRCLSAGQGMKAADLVVRDGNIPLIIFFLALNSRVELRKIPATAWHRLKLLAEKSGITLLVFTPEAQVHCARLRLSVSPGFPLVKLSGVWEELAAELSVQEERRRAHENRA